MPVKSLMTMALSACMKHSRDIDSFGDLIAYDLIRPILLKIDNAHQLRQIELNSPQLEGEMGEIWLKLIEKEFPMEVKATAYKPSDPKKWYKVWERYKKDHDRALQESEAKLKMALNGLRQAKENNMSSIADKKLDKKLLPRTARKAPWGSSSWGQRDPHASTFSFGRGTRTKTNTGASVMRKVRREVKEIANIHGSLSRVTKGSAALTRPARAPASMVNDVRRRAQPSYRTQPVAAVTEYEERATYLSDSDDSDDSDANDLFDDDRSEDEERLPTRKSVKSSSRSLLKRPASKPVMVSIKSRAPAVPASSSSASRPVKRGGILSNKFKPGGSKTQLVQSKPSSSKATSSSGSSKPPQKPPQRSHRERISPPPPPAADTGSWSPPSSSMAASAEGQSRKRKSVNIFMSSKKKRF